MPMNKQAASSFQEAEANHRQRIKEMTPAQRLRLVSALSETARRLAKAKRITRVTSVSK
jgi:hypothetical protein